VPSLIGDIALKDGKPQVYAHARKAGIFHSLVSY